jgi:hypothetical protein
MRKEYALEIYDKNEKFREQIDVFSNYDEAFNYRNDYHKTLIDDFQIENGDFFVINEIQRDEYENEIGVERVYEEKVTDDFWERLGQQYTVEDITGNFGVLLDNHADEEDRMEAMKFIQNIYSIAVQHL